MDSPRVLIAAPASGSGKTTVACGLLRALTERGLKARAFKCGPDYIDPLFHEAALGVPSANLDLFFDGAEGVAGTYARYAEGADVSVIEGVMGYYDGLAAASDEGSAYRTAKALSAPAVLVADARGQSLSAVAALEGFLRFRPDSGIRGVIFDRMSEGTFAALRAEVERLGVKALGHLPNAPDVMVKSRHLGLVTPGEMRDIGEKLESLARLTERTVDVDGVLELAASAPFLETPEKRGCAAPRTRIAVAKDEAFCFLYRANLDLLRELGAELVFFSPIRDKALPEGTCGLLLPGGYPELYAEALTDNATMRAAIAEAVRGGMPCLAECGGFLYLHREMEDMRGAFLPMAGVLNAKAWRTPRLGRFGYVALAAKKDTAFLPAGETVRGHEFHYYESESCGEDLRAEKPSGARGWDCVHAEGRLFAGFPHLYYPSDRAFAERFVRACAGEG